MADNERTSPRIAALAAKFLQMDNPKVMTDEMWSEIKSVFAAALTQTPDKPKNIFAELRKARQNSWRSGTLPSTPFGK